MLIPDLKDISPALMGKNFGYDVEGVLSGALPAGQVARHWTEKLQAIEVALNRAAGTNEGGMTRERCEVAWEAIDLTHHDNKRLLLAIAYYQRWLDDNARLVHVRGDEWGDRSGWLEDVFDTREERIALYESLGEWAEGEYTGQWEPTYVSGMGKHFTRLIRDMARDDDNALFAVLMSAVNINKDSPNYDDVRHWAWDLIAENSGCSWNDFPCHEAAAFNPRIEDDDQ